MNLPLLIFAIIAVIGTGIKHKDVTPSVTDSNATQITTFDIAPNGEVKQIVEFDLSKDK